MYDPFTATTGPGGVPFASGRTAAAIAYDLIEEAKRLATTGSIADAREAAELLRDAAYLLDPSVPVPFWNEKADAWEL